MQQFAWLHHCIMHRDLIVRALTSNMLEAQTQGCGSTLNLRNCLENLPAQAENPFIHAYDDGNEEKNTVFAWGRRRERLFSWKK